MEARGSSCLRTRSSARPCLCLRVCMCVSMSVRLCMCMCVCMSVRLCVYMCVCMRVRLCMYTCTWVCSRVVQACCAVMLCCFSCWPHPWNTYAVRGAAARGARGSRAFASLQNMHAHLPVHVGCVGVRWRLRFFEGLCHLAWFLERGARHACPGSAPPFPVSA